VTSERAEWQVCTTASAGEREFVEGIANALREGAESGGVLVYLSGDGEVGDECIAELLAGAKAALDCRTSGLFVLVHHGHPGVAVARTLHQEACSLVTRIIELPRDTPQLRRDAPGWVVEEVRSAAEFVECRYDAAGQRSERSLAVLPVLAGLSGANAGESGALPLGRDDVLLVAGGGKGIAAECALDLVKESGCALGILGRSSPEADDELAGNLARFADTGARVAYAAVDVADAAAVSRAVDAIEAELGLITGLIHGAGINTPRSLVALTEEDFAHTMAPKVQGLENLFARLAGNPLRCVVGFGSIIAQIGLPGEADYAYANELLARHIEAYAADHPETRALCLEWSIWSGVGMGERLGRVEALAAQNISAISPDLGIAWLRTLLSRDDLPVRLVVCGRIGSPPTLRNPEVKLPILRFLERVREHTPGVELIADAELSFGTDPYLADHIYGGEVLLPGVMGLEAMAQVAAALCGGEGAPRFDAVEFIQPVALPRDGRCVLQSAALLREDGCIEVVLRCDASDFQVNHMRATLRFGEVTEDDDPLEGDWSEGASPELDPGRELYGDLFFHTGRFERVRQYVSLGARGCEVEIAGRDEKFFGAFQPQSLVLGDPGARDALIHAIQACVPERDLLPVAVERIEYGGQVEGSEGIKAWAGERPLRLRARERHHEGNSYTYDVALHDADGALVERWLGLELRVVGGAAPRTSWPPGLIAPHIEALASVHLPGSGIVAALVSGVDAGASQRAVSVASGAPVRLRRRPDGKPCLEGAEVSSSHALGYTLGVVAQRPAACDMEAVESRDPEIWRDLLGEARFELAQQLSAQMEEGLDQSATRLWGAGECLKKLGSQRETPVTLRTVNGSTLAEFEAGSASILSFVVQLSGAQLPAVITLIAEQSLREPVRGGHA
jgi:enediyne polyketide synthase